jgi:glycosyltransferase involved in cell wall biosynthesis
MRTLAVLHIPEAGGPAQHVRPWLEELAQRGSLEVVAPDEGSALALYSSFATTTVLPYQALRLGRGLLDALRLGGRFAREVRVFRRHMRRARPDLVVVVTSVVPSAAAAAALAGVPTIVYVGELYDRGLGHRKVRRAGIRALVALLKRSASAIVCCSETVAAQFGSSAVTIYPGIELDRTAAGVEAPQKRSGPRLAVVGNITAARGQDVIVWALPAILRELPAATCVLAGAVLDRAADRAYHDELLALIAQLGLEATVQLPGFVDPVSRVYDEADIVVNPARFNEPLGLVALEALSAGRPVVATRVGAIPEVLTNEHDALLVEPDQPEALAEAIVRLWRDEALRSALVSQGRPLARKRFELQRSVAEFGKLVDGVLAGRSASDPAR